MPPLITHISPVLDFLSDLQEHNSRQWMEAHRPSYQQAKAQFVELVQTVLEQLRQFDDSLHDVNVPECLFRINKNDFSGKDAPVYKGHFGAGISQGGRHSVFANYVLILEPNGKSRVGGGMRAPSARQLQLIREEIDYNPGELEAILGHPEFAKAFGGFRGEPLKTSPKGYGKDHPAIGLLRHKGFQVLHYFTDEEVCAPDFVQRLLPFYLLVKPLHDFLNRAITE